MGNASIDLSLTNIWKSWYNFRRGKRKTNELDYFQYYLEGNLRHLDFDLNRGIYKHGGYHKFIVNDNKRREISVAGIIDRVVHRLIYEYLVEIYDKTFIFDAWSCRKNKGLIGAIERTQRFLKKYPQNYIWRSDVRRFFDNADHDALLKIIRLKINDLEVLNILTEIVKSYSILARRKGIPIGNLTSQIFANIYFNEFDRFVKHVIKPQAYLRYGDDFVII